MTPLEASKKKYPAGFTIIGTGRLGSSLALRLHSRGYHIRSLYNRTLASCKSLAALTGNPVCSTFPEKESDLGDLVFICLPDDQIAGFAAKMAEHFSKNDASRENRQHFWPREPLWADEKDADRSRRQCQSGEAPAPAAPRIRPAWIHTSGASPAEVLRPLSGYNGSGIASFHPVQTFNRDNREKAFDGCFVTLQGDRALCDDLKVVVRAIGARPLIVDKEQKTAIHLAAVFVCNYMAPLFSASQHILSDNNVAVRSRDLFGPIVRQTLEGLLSRPPEEVLTGPVVRGDTGTIERHLSMLAKSPQWERIYRELGKVTLHLARNIEGRQVSSDAILENLFDTESLSDTAGKGKDRHGDRLEAGKKPGHSDMDDNVKETDDNKEPDFYERVYDVVARIPKGKVTTYGAIARYLGTGGSARLVGWALNKTVSAGDHSSMSMLPCHRVVNRNGELTGKAWFGGDIMEQLLRSEGVTFDPQGRVNMNRHFWHP